MGGGFRAQFLHGPNLVPLTLNLQSAILSLLRPVNKKAKLKALSLELNPKSQETKPRRPNPAVQELPHEQKAPQRLPQQLRGFYKKRVL